MTLISELIITIPPRETSREDKEKVHDNMEDCWRAEKKRSSANSICFCFCDRDGRLDVVHAGA
jgi:hypothetical protein